MIRDENIWKAATICSEPTGEKLIGGADSDSDTERHALTHAHTDTAAASPLREVLTESALPVTEAAIILQVLSADHLLQVCALLATSVSTRALHTCVTRMFRLRSPTDVSIHNRFSVS